MANKRKNIRKKTILAIGGLFLVIMTCFFILKFMHNLENTPLQSTWRSEETGQILTFKENQQVTFKGYSSNGIYHILSPNTIEYTIDNKTFNMIYHVEKNKLYWGMDEEHLECFVKTWF